MCDADQDNLKSKIKNIIEFIKAYYFFSAELKVLQMQALRHG